MATDLTVSTGRVSSTADVVLTIGPQHPRHPRGAAARAVRRRTTASSAAQPIVGYMHRGAEKLFEARDFRQILVLANRHDWLSAFSSELGVALAVERMLGMQVPERATWIRTLAGRAQPGAEPPAVPRDVPAGPASGRAASGQAYAAREAIQARLEEVSGGRMHYMFNQVGGLKQDLPEGWLGTGSRHGRRRPVDRSCPSSSCRRICRCCRGSCETAARRGACG